MGRSVRQPALRQGQRGRVHLRGGGQCAPPRLVDDHESRRRTFGPRATARTQRLLDGREPLGHRGEVGHLREDTDEAHRKHRPGLQEFIGKLAEPAGELWLLPLPLHGHHRQLHEVGSEPVVTGRERMVNGRSHLAVLLEPDGCPAVQLGHPALVALDQVGAQDVGEQMVVAPPLPAVIERHQEKPGAFELDELRGRAGSARHRVAERPVEPLEDGRLQQEVADGIALARQHLVGEVVDDEAVVTGEPGHDRARIVPVLQRQTGQLERRRPTLGALRERGDVVGRKAQPDRIGQVLLRFVAGEAQLCGANLDEHSAGP